MPTDNVSGADNQQETCVAFYYYTGFCCGEGSFSLLKLSNRKSKKGGVYYTPDFTVSNAELSLLKEINNVVAHGCGIISKIKGGYNLSFRGKEKAKKAISFLEKYPPPVGDLFKSRLMLLKRAINLLEAKKGYRRSEVLRQELESIRNQFSKIKKTAIPISEFPLKKFDKVSQGYFLSGVFDAEGSVGFKSNGSRKQPFFAVAMKDHKIVELFKDYFKVGNIHLRPKEKMIHYEVGAQSEVRNLLQKFFKKYPPKLRKMRERVERTLRILNDYTQGPKHKNLGMI